jgi:hypothetical protein
VVALVKAMAAAVAVVLREMVVVVGQVAAAAAAAAVVTAAVGAVAVMEEGATTGLENEGAAGLMVAVKAAERVAETAETAETAAMAAAPASDPPSVAGRGAGLARPLLSADPSARHSSGWKAAPPPIGCVRWPG